MKKDDPPFSQLFLVILMLMTIGFVATDLYLPSLPSIQNSLNSSSSLVQLTLTFYLFTFSSSQLFYGPLSDRFGRRKIVILGLSFSFIGNIICIASVNIYMLLLGRALEGLALGVGASIGRAIMRDIYSGERLAHFSSFIPLGTSAFMAIAPTVGGYIQRYLGWRMNFLAILIYAFLGLIMMVIWLPETNKHLNELATRPAVFFGNYFHLLKSPIFVGYCMCATLSFGGLLAYFAASPFLFQNVLELTPIEYGWLAFIVGGGIGIGGYSNSLLLKHFGRHRMLVAGVVTMFLSGILMLIPALFKVLSVFVVMVPMFFYSVGAAATFANSFAGAFHPFAKIAGFAGALYSFFQIFGGALATAITAAFHAKNQLPLSMVLICASFLAYFLQLLAFKKSVKTGFH